YAQAGWFDLAEKELDRLATDLPTQRDRVKASKETLARMRFRDRWEQVKRWHGAGRHEGVRKALAAFPEKGTPANVLADVRLLRAEYARTDERMLAARKYLTALEARVVGDPAHKELARAASIIRNELHPATVDRLDAFLGQARQ